MANYSVGIFASSINPNLFGSSRNIYYLAKALEAKGCRVTVFCPDNQANREIKLNKIYVPGRRWSFIPNIIPQSFKVAKKARGMESEFDIFHSNCCCGFPYAFHRNKPFVVHLRSIWLKDLKALISANFSRTLLLHEIPYQTVIGLIERYATKNSDLVFCNSKQTALEANKVLRVNPNRIREVPNGVDVEFFLRGDGGWIREKYELKDRRILLCVTRLTLYKRTDRLLSAMKIVAREREDVVLILVGGGELGSEVRRNIIKGGLSRNVILTGHISDEHLADFYAAADLFIYPYSPGTTLLEAMAAGKPFVLFYKSKDAPPGVPLDNIADKRIGRIIRDDEISTFAEEIMNYIDDGEWLSNHGKKGLQFVKQELSWDKIAEQVISYYEQVI